MACERKIIEITEYSEAEFGINSLPDSSPLAIARAITDSIGNY